MMTSYLIQHSRHVYQVHVVRPLVSGDPLAYHKMYQVDGPPHLTEHGVPGLPGRGRVGVAEDALGAGHQEDGGSV